MKDEKAGDKGGKAKPEKGKPVSKGPAGPLTNFDELIWLFFLLILLIPALGYVWTYIINHDSGAQSGGIIGVIADAIANLYAMLNTVASVVAMLAIAIAVYSFIRISELAAAETKKLGLALNWNSERKQKNERWVRVETYMTSLNQSDWKIAILEADNILDQIVERMGYDGATLGERMKQIEASDFPYLEEAWVAHKTRNSIAHKGTDYELSRSDAERTINIYHRVFKELGYL